MVQIITHYSIFDGKSIKPIEIGAYVRITFCGGGYIKGDIKSITTDRITLERSDGDYNYNISEIEDIIVL